MKTFHMLVNNLAMMNLAPTGFLFILGIQYIDGSCLDSSSILMSNKLLNLYIYIIWNRSNMYLLKTPTTNYKKLLQTINWSQESVYDLLIFLVCILYHNFSFTRDPRSLQAIIRGCLEHINFFFFNFKILNFELFIFYFLISHFEYYF